jgi:hypothetical protein
MRLEAAPDNWHRIGQEMIADGLIMSADVAQSINDARGAVTGWLGRFSTVDWVLVAVALILLAWGWVRAFAPARLGTIDIGDLAADSGLPILHSAGAVGIKAELQKQIGERGWLPAGAVPSGSPSVASLAGAVGDAPFAQGKWIADIINLST